MAPKFEKWGRDAEILYVEYGLSIPAIAQKLPVRTITLRRWRERADWESKRLAYSQSTREGVRTILYKLSEFMEIWKKRKGTNAGEADILTKLVNSVEKLDRRSLFPSFALQFIEEMTEFLRGKHPEKMGEWASIVQEFSQVLWQKYRILT
jgi:uncharacterized protein YjcR